MGNTKKEINAKLDAHHSGQSNEPISGPAHTLSFEEVAQQLKSSAIDGLTPDEAKKRLEHYGKNELDNGPGVNPVRILIRQIANAMMLVSRRLPLSTLSGSSASSKQSYLFRGKFGANISH